MIGAAVTVLDGVLASAVLVVAAVLLNVPSPFTAIVLFIIFGLLMSTTWARLDAVDIALAEAAIGAGITGALLLNALGDIAARGGGGLSAEVEGPRAGIRSWRSLLAALLVAPIAVILGHAVLSAPGQLDELRPRVQAALEATGVEHDVTAVLLSFRAYDTLLELGVLLLAVIGAWGLRLPRGPRETPPLGSVLRAAERVLVPVTILIGGYLLWRGSRAPGGAFQGGAVLAGAAVLLHLGFRTAWPKVLEPAVGLALVAGVLSLGGVGLIATVMGHPFLFYRGALAGILIPAVEALAAVSIALALVGVFIGRAYWEPEEDE